MKLRHFLLGTALLFLSLVAGCSFAEKKQEIPSPVTLYPIKQTAQAASTPLFGRTVTIVTGDMSGVYFPLGEALAGIYERYGGAVTGTRMTKASIENLKLVTKKQAELGFTSVDALFSEGKNSSPELRAITGLYFNYVHIAVSKKSGIHSLKDLAGKKVSIGPVDSGTALSAERVLQAAHLTGTAIQKHSFSFTQSEQALRDGVIDAAFFSSGLPNPDLSSLVDDTSFTLLSIPEDVQAALQQAYPYYAKRSIPAETYHGLQRPIHTIAVQNMLVTYRDLPEDTAYELTKHLYEHLPELYEIHPAARGINTAEADLPMYLPLHPGAARYFTETNQTKRVHY